MESPAESLGSAWLPITPKGVAMFAQASLRRLVIVQLVIAVLSAGTILWVVSIAWCPAISAAIEHLPEKGEIKAGRLLWSDPSPRTLSEGRFLAFMVDLNHTARVRSPAHIQIEFGEHDVRFYSLFGWLPMPYPGDRSMPFNLEELKPRWGAWLPSLLASTGATALVFLIVTWWLLATVYCLPVWLLGLYLDRELTFLGSWRLAGAALMPGALLMTVAIGLYGLGQLDVIRLIAASALHFAAGWTYLVLGTVAAPKTVTASGLKANPFQIKTASTEAQPSPEKKESSNPFHPPGD